MLKRKEKKKRSDIVQIEVEKAKNPQCRVLI